MIAKLVVHGATRDIALARLRQALSECEVSGTVTNLGFLGALAAHDGFALGKFDTGLIERHIAELIRKPPVLPVHWIAAGMATLGIAELGQNAGFSLWQPIRHKVTLSHDGETVELGVEILSPESQIWYIGDEVAHATLQSIKWLVAGVPVPKTHLSQNSVTVFDNHGLTFDVRDPLAQSEGGLDSGDVIEAPMPGLVKHMVSRPGQSVVKGDTLAVLEAMKMEYSLKAARDGVIADVLVQEGDQVAAGTALVLLEEELA